jgi:excisionase family DNA binding protein
MKYLTVSEVAKLLGVSNSTITINVIKYDMILHKEPGDKRLYFNKSNFNSITKILEDNIKLRKQTNNKRFCTAKVEVNRDRGMYHRLTPFGGILNREFDKPGEIA